MKMLGRIAVVVAIVGLLGATIFYYQKFQKSSSDFATLQTENEETRNRYAAAVDEIAAIQDSLNTIVLGDEAARLIPSGLDAEQGLTRAQGDRALERIAVLKAGIQRTKDKIKELDASLKARGIKIEGLQRMVANLKKSVTEKEEAMAQLTTQVNQLQTEVTGLTAQVEEKDATIAEKDVTIETKRKELGTVLYVIGSKKELTESGILVASGGVLGMGKTLEPSGHMDETRFTAIDTDQETAIRIPADKVEIVSAQPTSSYVLEPVGENQVELRIVNPTEFRKVKHLVIMTA
jgi:predicted RNase H-like nuclease (RuvC/YqgF family)